MNCAASHLDRSCAPMLADSTMHSAISWVVVHGGSPADADRWIAQEDRTVRIAILAPLVEPVPPPLYGGTERVVSLLTEELVRRGHEVTLFASGDSVTSARLAAVTERALRLDATSRE